MKAILILVLASIAWLPALTQPFNEFSFERVNRIIYKGQEGIFIPAAQVNKMIAIVENYGTQKNEIVTLRKENLQLMVDLSNAKKLSRSYKQELDNTAFLYGQEEGKTDQLNMDLEDAKAWGKGQRRRRIGWMIGAGIVTGLFTWQAVQP